MIILGKSDRGSARTSSCPSDHSPDGAKFLTNSTPFIINHDVRLEPGIWDPPVLWGSAGGGYVALAAACHLMMAP